MRQLYRRVIARFVIVLLGAFFVISPACATEYTITYLGALYAGPSAESQAYAINIHDQITGETTSPNGDQHAFLYSGGVMMDLGTLWANTNGLSYGYAINDQGVVAGQSENTNGEYNPFYLQTAVPGARMVDMGTLGGVEGGIAFGINNLNAIVGDATTTDDQIANAFLSSVGGTMQNLGLTSYDYSGGRGINDSGVIVGQVQLDVSGEPYVPFIDTGTGITELPLNPGDTSGNANAINASGVAVGVSGSQAVAWLGGATGSVQSLGYLPTNGTSPSSVALGLNDVGQIVGASEVSFAIPHAFIYENGKMSDLNDLIAPGHAAGFAYLARATGINNNGDITGYGLQTNGDAYFGFLAKVYAPSGGLSGPAIVMNRPVLTNNQALLNFSVYNLSNATYHLLETPQVNTNSWSTNTTAVFTTNVLDSSYRFTDTKSPGTRYYRVRSP
ncbi:MAG: hypothetical protein ABSH48_23060 [Verrucomicrobiota bacterium]|jgi:probable HAF family extracellular repeat protein